jgi:hypothetical protein
LLLKTSLRNSLYLYRRSSMEIVTNSLVILEEKFIYWYGIDFIGLIC